MAQLERTTAPHGPEANQRTVQAYEGYARRYAEVTGPEISRAIREAFGLLLPTIGTDAHVLEIGSGPGWDADALEALGPRVRRTDVTAAFRGIQAERGKVVEPLDLLIDDLGGPYDAVLTLYVFQHFERDATAALLAKVAAALRPAGQFLVSLREGTGEMWELSDTSGAYRVVERSREEFEAALDAAGFDVRWSLRTTDSDGGWLVVLAERRA